MVELQQPFELSTYFTYELVPFYEIVNLCGVNTFVMSSFEFGLSDVQFIPSCFLDMKIVFLVVALVRLGYFY